MDANETAILSSIADSLRRLADHFAPVETQRERHPATLTTAIYDRDERERAKLGQTLRRKEPESPRRTFEASED